MDAKLKLISDGLDKLQELLDSTRLHLMGIDVKDPFFVPTVLRLKILQVNAGAIGLHAKSVGRLARELVNDPTDADGPEGPSMVGMEAALDIAGTQGENDLTDPDGFVGP